MRLRNFPKPFLAEHFSLHRHLRVHVEDRVRKTYPENNMSVTRNTEVSVLLNNI